jgi:2-polyprenyl-6-methoxyphenol hydroxylase-like FAD-dependent oxidoreductase
VAAKRALVIGGGIAGMCAARALADAYDQVVVLERDRYPDGATQRRGVPQSRMFHNLIERGRREIEDLFPGYYALLDERGAPRVAGGFNVAALTLRGWGEPAPAPVIRGIFCSRLLMESALLELIRKVPNVQLREEMDVLRLLAEQRDGRLTCYGAEIRHGELTERLEADLVVDASGAHSRAPQWLEELGLAPPEDEMLDPLLTYGGQWLQMRPGARWPGDWWWTHGVFIQRIPPYDRRSAHLMRQENDKWLLTLVAGGGEEPPMDPEGIADFLASLRSPLISQMMPLFEPTTKMTGYRLRANRWRHYERWGETLDGFLAIGDSTCVFNPNLGQGMTVAATEAGILRRCVRRTTSPRALPKLFFAEQGRFVRTPWRLATANDLNFDSVIGKRSLGLRLFNWYRRQLVSAGNRHVQRHLAEIDMLLRPVIELFNPAIGMLAGVSRFLPKFSDDGFDPFGPYPRRRRRTIS